MQQARDFLEESDALAALLQNLPAEDWTTATLFKNWTINDVVVHLYYWNIGADLALVNPDAFQHRAAQVVAALGDGGLRPVENAAIAERFGGWNTLIGPLVPQGQNSACTIAGGAHGRASEVKSPIDDTNNNAGPRLRNSHSADISAVIQPVTARRWLKQEVR